MFLTAVLQQAYVAQFVLETAWLNDSLCGEPPSIITIFTITNPSALYQTWSADYIYPYCSRDVFPVPNGCCISSLNPQNSFNVKSVSYSMDLFEMPDQLFYQSANNEYYCKYTEQNGRLLDWGYLTRFLSPNAYCFDGISCYNSAEIRIFDHIDCTGSFKSFNLNNTPIIVESPALKANLSVSYIKLSGGQTTTMWTAFFPSGEATPNFQWPLEIFGMVCYLLAIVVASIVSAMYIKQYYDGDQAAKTVLLSQIMWIAWVILSLAYWVTVFQSFHAWLIMLAFNSILYNIASMIAVTDTYSMILNFINVKKRSMKFFAYSILVIVHLVLAGSGYIFIVNLFPNLVGIYTDWYYIFPLWNLFQFSINTFPALYIYYRIIRLYADKHSVDLTTAHRKTGKNSLAVSVLLPCQISNTLLYMFLSVVIEYTSILGNDRNFMAWNGLMCLSNILHEVLNLSLMASLNKLVMKMHNGALSMSSQSKPEQSKIGEPGDNLFNNSSKTMGPPEKDMHAIAERRRSVFVNGRSLKNALLEEESRISEVDKPSVKIPTSTSMRQIPGVEIEQRVSVSTKNASLRISVDTNHSGPKIDSAGITAEGSPKKSPHQDEQKIPAYHGEDSHVNPFHTSGSRRATINTFQPARTSDRGSSFDDYRKRFSVLQPAKEERIDEGSAEPATNTSVTTRKKRERRVTLDSKVTNPMEMLTKIELLKQSAAEEQGLVKDVPDNNQIECPAEQKEPSLINPPRENSRKNISEQNQPPTLDPRPVPPDSDA